MAEIPGQDEPLDQIKKPEIDYSGPEYDIKCHACQDGVGPCTECERGKKVIERMKAGIEPSTIIESEAPEKTPALEETQTEAPAEEPKKEKFLKQFQEEDAKLYRINVEENRVEEKPIVKGTKPKTKKKKTSGEKGVEKAKRGFLRRMGR